MMIDLSKVLDIVKQSGPVLPVDIARKIEQNTIITGAILSDLVKSKKVLVSHTKVGGSPVYYLPEQKHRLQNLYKYLNEKDQRAFDYLKREGLLQDNKLEPLQRVCLRNIRDFAKPLEVSVKNEKILFWKWYLLSNEDAQKKLHEIFRPKKEVLAKTAEPKETKESQAEENTDRKTEVKTTEPAKESKKEEPQFQVQRKLSDEGNRTKAEEEQKEKQATDISDTLHQKITKYLQSKDISIEKIEIIKKNSEIDYLVLVPSNVGPVEFYTKAKKKKKVNEKDLAFVATQGQLKKLPVIFLITGELTKKAKEMHSNSFSSIIIKEI
jgi:hypothetical protein